LLCVRRDALELDIAGAVADRLLAS